MKPPFPAFLFAAVIPVVAAPVFETTCEPRGRVVEVHGCQVLAGGCVASSEATLGGRSLLRIWQFEGGSHQGFELGGLTIATLQVAQGNLACKSTDAGQMVLYVPDDLDLERARALTAWVASQEAEIDPADVVMRRTEIVLTEDSRALRGRIGEHAEFEAGAPEPCGLRGCGQQLWYEPRSTVSAFVVLENRRLEVREARLGLRWQDHGKPSVFLGRFGESPELARARLLASELCGG